MNFDTQQLNTQLHQNIPTGRLRISPYEVEQLLEVVVEQRINQHSTLYFKGVLPEEKSDSYKALSIEGDNVVLSYLDSEDAEHILYQGIVKNLEIKAVGKHHHLEVYALSYSSLMDVEKKWRSFQNKASSYTALASQVTGGYPGGGVIDVATDGEPTGKFIVQYYETDWEFLARLASRFNSGLVGDVRFDAPNFYFGIPNSQSLVLESGNYVARKDLARFRQLAENGVEGLREGHFVRYEIKTRHITNIGDTVIFQGKELYVYEIITKALKDGLMDNFLVLTPKEGLSQPYIPHTNIVGASLGGHILLAQDDMVKVALDIDREHDPGEPCFFPYSTVYSSQDGSGWYCMPEIGDRVRIYCPDGEDDHSFALSSVHEQVDPDLLQQNEDKDRPSSSAGGPRASGKAGGYSGLRDAPEVKSMTYGSKEIRLTPEGVYIITEDSVITMTAAGILVMSENNIAIKSDKNISVSAAADINVTGAEGVALMCGGSTGLVITDDVKVVGAVVNSN